MEQDRMAKRYINYILLVRAEPHNPSKYLKHASQMLPVDASLPD